MEYILSPQQMREADTTAIKKYGIAGPLLMENAARSSALVIREFFDEWDIMPDTLILCGSGNNGGDGFALARHLYDDFNVEVAWIGDEKKMSPETKTNYESVKKLKIPMTHIKDENIIKKLSVDKHLIIDSMIGVGGSENLRGLVIPILEKVNETDSMRVAIDAPTGLNTETGIASEYCFLADHTITMFAVKTGMLLNQGISNCGSIHIVDLGAPEFIVQDISNVAVLDENDIDDILPVRELSSTKFDNGRCVMIAGSVNMPGAAALASNAAIKSGAGLVYLYSPHVHPSILPEIIPFNTEANMKGGISLNNYERIMEMAEKADVFAMGPGIGDDPNTLQLISKLIDNLPDKVNLVIDADAIKALKNDIKYRENMIITPHTGEFANLIEMQRQDVEADSFNLTTKWAKELGLTIHLKHFPKITSNGEETFFNLSGNPGMATAGSGDVLTGIIAGLWAQLPDEDATLITAAADKIHSIAGDHYAERYSEMTLTASSILKSLEYIFEE